ncbi:ATP-binding protein [Asanoa sp. NPDC049518]|uniref:ATP-binding protein n=1 Tax=unclassified Asanoa TaxID=2685164 RepID=UPI003423A8C8
MKHQGLDCRIDKLPEATVVSASGPFDGPAAPGLRRVLLKCLVDEPKALILELFEITVVEEAALAVVPAVARQASIWPGVPFAVAASRGVVSDAINRLGAGRTFPLLATTGEALAVARDGGASPTVREFLPPVAGAARHARTVTTDACLRWELEHLFPAACVVVSELVSNASRHANTTMSLRLSYRSRYLLIAVEDGSTAPPTTRAMPDATDTGSGRGIPLINVTADRWGWLPTDGGKVVWAALRA